MADRILETFEDLSQYIDDADGTAFGIPGYDADEGISKKMQAGNSKSPAVSGVGRRAVADGGPQSRAGGGHG